MSWIVIYGVDCVWFSIGWRILDLSYCIYGCVTNNVCITGRSWMFRSVMNVDSLCRRAFSPLPMSLGRLGFSAAPKIETVVSWYEISFLVLKDRVAWNLIVRQGFAIFSFMLFTSVLVFLGNIKCSGLHVVLALQSRISLAMQRYKYVIVYISVRL